MKILSIFVLILIASSALSLTSFDFNSAVNQNLINSIKNLNTTWTPGINTRFSNITLSDAKRLLGAWKTPSHLKQILQNIKPKIYPSLKELPESFDLREAHKNCTSIGEVRDQSACGSCWAIAAVAAMSDRICIASNYTLQARLSASNLISCCSACGNGCDGGYPTAAWNYWQDNGLPTGGLYQDNSTCQPYPFQPCDHHVDEKKYGPCNGNYDTPDCSDKCVDEYGKKLVEDDLHFGNDVYMLFEDEEEIKAEIYENGSVEAAFLVYEDFLSYKSGVYQNVKGAELGGHAVKMIGWGIENNVKYWLMVNSWNEGWGDKGFFKILRGQNHLGIESDIVAAKPKFDNKTDTLMFLQ